MNGAPLDYSNGKKIAARFFRHKLAAAALFVAALFCVAGIYAPFLASSKPIAVVYDREWYFPLFRYLFYPGFYTKYLDIFFNIMMITFPFFVCGILYFYKNKKQLLFFFTILCFVQLGLFTFFILWPLKDPASNPILNKEKESALRQKGSRLPDWDFELRYMTPYAKLNEILQYRIRREQNGIIVGYLKPYIKDRSSILTLWQIDEEAFKQAKRESGYLVQKQNWLEKESRKITLLWMPLLRPYHWEDDAGGSQLMNRYLPWWELTRINRKDLVSALIFGVRISLVVGILSIALALCIGIPIGCFSGYYGGTSDIIVCRLLEIWESMPTFFMLLLVVAIIESKSIFIVIAVIGLFGWTTFSRYVRGEFFKQRNLPYVEACHALGFRDSHIMFSHILPNAIPPVITLLPFAIMGAISSEAGLSFLGLGEENSCSWGILMDEGRTAFPAESYLLWPPALLLTILLVSIALIGDALRDALDPKMHQ